jgi:hypothetical protein
MMNLIQNDRIDSPQNERELIHPKMDSKTIAKQLVKPRNKGDKPINQGETNCLAPKINSK